MTTLSPLESYDWQSETCMKRCKGQFHINWPHLEDIDEGGVGNATQANQDAVIDNTVTLMWNDGIEQGM